MLTIDKPNGSIQNARKLYVNITRRVKMEKVNIGIIGAGRIGQLHANNILHSAYSI